MTSGPPEPEATSVRTEPLRVSRARPGRGAALLWLLVLAAWNAGVAWAASRFGRFIAKDAGLTVHPLWIEVCPILIAGLVCGLLLRARPEPRDRIGPFVALALGSAAGFFLATRVEFETALRWPIFVAPAAWAAFARSVSRR